MMSIKREFYSLGATENDITARPLCIGLMFEQQQQRGAVVQYNAIQLQYNSSEQQKD
jgi:hypothetical protein